MKRLIAFFISIVLFSACGCYSDKPKDTHEDSDSTQSEIPEISPGGDQSREDTDSTNSPEGPKHEIEQPEPDNITIPLKKIKSYIISTTDSLRVRSKPSATSTTLGYLDKADGAILLGESGSYYKTVYKEKTAYVHKAYCEIMQIEESDPLSESAIDLGSTLLGYPYVWGSQRYHWGNGKLNTNFVNGEFDCSALVQYVYFKSSGIKLNLTTREQVSQGRKIDRSELLRGDLMFFTNSSRQSLSGNERIGHVAIYLGNNYILHTASDHAVIEPISTTRWSYYVTARRVV